MHTYYILSDLLEFVRAAVVVRRYNLLPRFDCLGDIEIIGAIAHCLG